MLWEDLSAAERKTLTRIARDSAAISTLEERKSDSLDFHDIGVLTLREMLVKAYTAGMDEGE